MNRNVYKTARTITLHAISRTQAREHAHTHTFFRLFSEFNPTYIQRYETETCTVHEVLLLCVRQKLSQPSCWYCRQ